MQNFISAKVPLYGLNNYIEINLGEDKINLKECLEILYSKRLRDAAENVLRGNELNTSCILFLNGEKVNDLSLPVVKGDRIFLATIVAGG